jgi:hypothetical protein
LNRARHFISSAAKKKILAKRIFFVSLLGCHILPGIKVLYSLLSLMLQQNKLERLSLQILLGQPSVIEQGALCGSYLCSN